MALDLCAREKVQLVESVRTADAATAARASADAALNDALRHGIATLTEELAVARAEAEASIAAMQAQTAALVAEAHAQAAASIAQADRARDATLKAAAVSVIDAATARDAALARDAAALRAQYGEGAAAHKEELQKVEATWQAREAEWQARDEEHELEVTRLRENL